MDNVTQNSVIRQLISLLPIDLKERSCFDHYAKKLTVAKSIVIFAITAMKGWSSYREIETNIRAQPQIQQILSLPSYSGEIPSVSGSQLSRKLDRIPTEILQSIFLENAARIQALTAGSNGITSKIGKLAIVDSTILRLPLNMGNWAAMTRYGSRVKMHLRLVAASPDTVYPDAMLPSTQNVDDRDGAVDLIVEAVEVTYVMDRGYDKHEKMDDWVQRNIRFVMRVRECTTITVLEEFPVPAGSNITLDAKVVMGSGKKMMKQPLRLIEYTDEQGRCYRVATTRWDATAEEIAQIYKNRWLIELFFKWLKQNIRFVNLFSYKPQALWNQMFIALIAHQLVLYTKLSKNLACKPRKLLLLFQTYLFHSWVDLETELMRPTKPSRGRQPSKSPPSMSVRTTVGLIKTSKKTKTNK